MKIVYVIGMFAMVVQILVHGNKKVNLLYKVHEFDYCLPFYGLENEAQ